MLKNYSLFLLSFIILSCSSKKEQADLILHHAVIYSVDSAFNIYEAMAIKDGKILELNSNDKILKKYTANETMDLKNNSVFPGFIDAHCHFVAYGLGLKNVNLVGTKSFEEVLHRLKNYLKKQDTTWLIGRGWNQEDWQTKELPNRKKLDSLFPNRPVLLSRIDGHEVLVNSTALKLAGITNATKISGGEILKSKGELTGVLIDNAADLVTSIVPKPTKEDLFNALMNGQANCFAQGLTTVDDAGLTKTEVEAIDELQKTGKLKMRMYAMLSDNKENFDYYLNKGIYKTERLNVRAFKFYGDGSLGSRGACLFKDYNDKKNWRGFLLSDISHYEKCAGLLNEKGFQMNTHCIGDSAVSVLTNIYRKYCNNKNEHRWRIEHAQVLASEDFKNFSEDIIPSVQPTHATSDMYWAEARLGKERLKNAYAYKTLLNAAGKIALGTDFPVEDISPFKTFYAAVARQDGNGFPKDGFEKENALSREETLRGMTIWAAYANFEEKEKGSLEPGKCADFIILDKNIMTCEIKDILKTKVLDTYVNGENVFSLQ